MKLLQKTLPLLVLLIAFAALSWNDDKVVTNDRFIVLVKYKTQAGKSEETISQMTQLIEEVKKEPHFMSIKLHIDPKDATNILLYEEWHNADYYNNEHMKTPHLQKFMREARNFLAGPPEISQWKVAKEFR